MRKAIAAFLFVLGALWIPATTSVAQQPDGQGWWWKYRQVTPPVNPKAFVPQFPDAPDTPPPASVPADGLYVAADPTGPQAISALTWVIPENASATTLTLTASTPLTAKTTTIELCPTSNSWQPVQAGHWADAPLYHCDADAPVGVVPTDGSTITFNLGKLGQSQLIDVALVPTDKSAFQANFNKPDAKSLTVSAGAAADTSGSVGTTSNVLSPEPDFNSIQSALADPSQLPTLAPALTADTNQPTIGAAPTVPFRSAIAPVNAAAAPVGRDQMQVFGMFGLFGLAVMFTRFRGQAPHEPTSLVKFGKHRDEEAA